jgi:hypothetical protein
VIRCVFPPRLLGDCPLFFCAWYTCHGTKRGSTSLLVADSVAHHAGQGLARGRGQLSAGVDSNSLAADDGAWDTRTRAEDNI